MDPVTAGLLASTALSVGGSLFGGNSAKKAAKARAAELAALRQYQQGQLDTTTASYQPQVDVGNEGLQQLSSAVLDGDFSNFFASPNYQFTLGQGLRGATNSAAARGILNSGGTLAGLNDYAQGQAANQYQGYLSNLTGLTNMGLQGLDNQNAYRQSYTQSITGIGQQVAQANETARLAMPTAIMSALSGLSSGIGQATGSGGFGGGLGSILGAQAQQPQISPWGAPLSNTGYSYGY